MILEHTGQSCALCQSISSNTIKHLFCFYCYAYLIQHPMPKTSELVLQNMLGLNVSLVHYLKGKLIKS